MKICLAIFLSLQIVTNFTFFEDVVRIPVLIEHYRHHTEKETPDISFFDFIVLHYFSNSSHAEKGHESLPLNHSGDIGHVHVSPAFTLPGILKIFTQIPTKVTHIFCFNQDVPNQNLDSIFQPPKSII
jgi:hypothetical protein